MSRINDALRQAQKIQSVHTAGVPPRLAMASPSQPLPVAQSKSTTGRLLLWVICVVVIGGMIAAVFLAGRTSAGRSANESVAMVAPPAVSESTSVIAGQPPSPEPVVAPVIEPPASPAPMMIAPSDAPRVQGIFYLPGKATAILDGKTVHAGDRYQQYQVKEIAKASVTLVASDGRVIRLAMAN